MSHESWLTWVRTLVNESWLMTHVSQINPKWAKSIWVGKIPIQNVWEKPPYRVQNVWERNPHTKCMREKSPFKMYEKNPHTKCMRDLSPLYFVPVWEADCDFGRSSQMLPSQNKSPWPIRACPKGVLRQLRPIRSAFLLRPVWVQDLNLPSLLSAAAAETCTRIPIYKSMRDQYPVRPSNQNMHGWPGMEVFLPGWSGKIL